MTLYVYDPFDGITPAFGIGYSDWGLKEFDVVDGAAVNVTGSMGVIDFEFPQLSTIRSTVRVVVPVAASSVETRLESWYYLYDGESSFSTAANGPSLWINFDGAGGATLALTGDYVTTDAGYEEVNITGLVAGVEYDLVLAVNVETGVASAEFNAVTLECLINKPPLRPYMGRATLILATGVSVLSIIVDGGVIDALVSGRFVQPYIESDALKKLLWAAGQRYDFSSPTSLDITKTLVVELT